MTRFHFRGFSLIELSIAMAVVAILSSTIVPLGIRLVQIKAAQKTAVEMAMIEEASQNYYKDNHTWPANMATLKNGGYLNPNWTANNPWQNPYQISNTILTLTVSTDVPVQWTKLVASPLPASLINNNTVSSTVSTSQQSGSIQPGVIVAWSGTIASIPAGWGLCDGSTYNRVDGLGTITAPDLRDKFIVGARQDDLGVAKSSIMGIVLQTGGSIMHNHGGQTGSHTLTIDEIPPHHHSITTYTAWSAPGRVQGTSSGDQPTDAQTGDTGGGQGHTHFIFSDYHVPPFYALAFIMKL